MAVDRGSVPRPAVGLRRSAGWSVVVLLLLAGLLGMHGLGGHYGPMPELGSGPATSHVVTGTHPAGMHEDVATATRAAVTGAVDLHADLTVACLAVLTSGLVLLLALLGRRLRVGGSPAGRTGPAAVLPRARWVVGPPDLVAGLCVSRT